MAYFGFFIFAPFLTYKNKCVNMLQYYVKHS